MKSSQLKVLTSSNSDEHNTPEYLIEAAREVLGHINLDPMSNHSANKTVKAERYFTKENDGLSLAWFGTVWLNPPFSLIDKAVPKLISEYEEGRVREAVILLKSAVETKTYQLLYPYPFCELNKRVKFIPGDLTNVELFIATFHLLVTYKLYRLAQFFLKEYELKKFSDSSPFATTLFYLGSNYYKWNKVMSKYGRVHPGNDLFTILVMISNINELKNLGIK